LFEFFQFLSGSSDFKTTLHHLKVHENLKLYCRHVNILSSRKRKQVRKIMFGFLQFEFR